MKIKIHQCYSKNKFPLNIGCWLIKLFSKTNYSHYAISIKSLSGREMFYHSNYQGVHAEPKLRFLETYEIKNTYTIEPKMSHVGFYSFIEPYLGIKYGFMQVFGLFLMTIGLLKNNPFGSNKIICNELVVMMLNSFYNLGIDDFDGINFGYTEELLNETINTVKS